LQEGDLVQGVNGQGVSHTDQLFSALLKAGASPLKLRIIRNQQAKEITLPPMPFFRAETAESAGGFRLLVPRGGRSDTVTANTAVNNEPLSVLTDGRLAQGYGPVFANGTKNGAYKLDLGTATAVEAISSWSFNQNGNRGRQCVTLYGSDSAADPGWNTRDAAKFTPLASIDTGTLAAAEFTATSLCAPAGQSLGSYRWIVWECAPVSKLGENTAWQEFRVETTQNK
jgi:hypothetical protein